MKTIIIVLLTVFSTSSYAMLSNDHSSFQNTTPYAIKTPPNNDTTKISVAKSKIVIIDNDTTIKVNLSNNSTPLDNKLSFEEYENVNIEVTEGDESTRIIVRKDGDTIKSYEMNYDFEAEGRLEDIDFDKLSFDDKNSNSSNKSFTFPKKKKNRFKGHWSGLEFGLNNYVTNDFSVTPEESYMEINTGKSWNFNLNFAQFSVPLARDRFGLVSGLGLEWSNYHFSNNNNITKNTQTHTIESNNLEGRALKMNRLQTTYLTAPLLMELQLGSGSRDDRIAISAGIIGGLKLGSHTKFKSNDGKQKIKDDFYLQSFRYGVTARVNYDFIGFYFNYYNTPLFIDGKGPELYPFAAGLILSFD